MGGPAAAAAGVRSAGRGAATEVSLSPVPLTATANTAQLALPPTCDMVLCKRLGSCLCNDRVPLAKRSDVASGIGQAPARIAPRAGDKAPSAASRAEVLRAAMALHAETREQRQKGSR